MQTLGQAVKAAREQQHMSQERLAELAGVSRRTVISLEQDENVRRDVIENVASALGLIEIPLGRAVGKVDQKQPAAILRSFTSYIGELEHHLCAQEQSSIG